MTPAEAETLTLKSIVGRYTVSRELAQRELDDLQLRAEDFSQKPAQALWTALGSAIADQKPLDVVELCSALRGRVATEYVADVVCNSEGFLEADLMRGRVLRLRDHAHRKRISESLEGIRSMLREGATTGDCLSEMERITRDLSGDRQLGAQSLEGSLMSLGERLQAIQDGTRAPVLSTGIEALDYAIGGLHPTLTIIGALPGVGKSALLVSIARNLAAQGTKVGILSLEDERDWLTERIIAEASSVPLFLIGAKPLTKSQCERIETASAGVYELLKNILVDDSVAMTPAEAVASARAMVARGCKAIIVDHLGELRLERSERHDLDVQAALQDLRGIAKRYKVPMVVAAHLRRREGLTVNEVPRLMDFAFSASLERSARVALGLFRPEAEEGEDPTLGVAVLKQTKGPPDFDFRLQVGKLYGTVQSTPVSDAMRQAFGPWREQ